MKSWAQKLQNSCSRAEPPSSRRHTPGMDSGKNLIQTKQRHPQKLKLAGEKRQSTGWRTKAANTRGKRPDPTSPKEKPKQYCSCPKAEPEGERDLA